MPRILLWNIENFGTKGGTQQGTAVAAGGKEPTSGEEATRINAICDVVQETQPDIIVILEVMGDKPVQDLTNRNAGGYQVGYRETLLNGNNAQGAVLSLLAALRTRDEGSQWCLIPPRNLSITGTFQTRGQSSAESDHDRSGGKQVVNEAVAVYFKSQKYIFNGPAYNVENDITPSQHTSGKYSSTNLKPDRATAYTGPWALCLPLAMNTRSGTILDLSFARPAYSAYYNMPYFVSFIDNVSRKPFNLVCFHAALIAQSSRNQEATRALVNLLPWYFSNKVEVGGFQDIPGIGCNCIVLGDFNASPAMFLESGWRTVALPCPCPGDQLAVQSLSTTIGRLNAELQKCQREEERVPICFGQFPGYGYLKPEQTDNVILYSTLPVPFIISRALICNPFIGGASRDGKLTFRPKFEFQQMKTSKESGESQSKKLVGKQAIEAVAAAYRSNQAVERSLFAFYRKQRDISDHLPLVVNIQLPAPPKK